MKTLTELSGSLVRAAAAAIEEAKRSSPAAEPARPAEPPAEAPPAESAAEPAPEQKPAQAAATGLPAAAQEAVARATGVSGDRLALLCAAVEAAGGRVPDVRLVRVFGPEEPVSGAKTIAGHQYLVDLFPASMKQVAGSSREEGGRRGGRGRGGAGGRGGGGRGGGGGGEKSGTGGFSMDSLRDDRKNQRGGSGRPGGRRPGGGGGKPPGGAPGGG
jgi:hypothetical protein